MGKISSFALKISEVLSPVYLDSSVPSLCVLFCVFSPSVFIRTLEPLTGGVLSWGCKVFEMEEGGGLFPVSTWYLYQKLQDFHTK